VDTAAVADVVADEDFTAAHAIAGDVACSAVDDYLTFIHGVSDAVLGVAVDSYVWPVHEGCQVVAGRAVDGDFQVGFQVGSYVALTVDVVDFNFFCAMTIKQPQHRVEFFEGEFLRVYSPDLAFDFDFGSEFGVDFCYDFFFLPCDHAYSPAIFTPKIFS